MSDNEQPRDKYRDNDDTRGYAEGPDRNETRPDSRSEARGDARDARDAVGNTARGTDTAPSATDLPDAYDADLQRDNQRGREASGMEGLAADTRAGMSGASGAGGSFGQQGRQHDRQTQAASPAERGHDERPKQQEGHGGGGRHA